MKEFKDSKIRAKKKSSKSNKDIFDSLSITRELEKSLTIHEELEKEKIRVRNIQKRKLQKNILKGVFIAFIIVCVSYLFWLQKTFKVNDRAMQAMIQTPGISVVKQNNGSIDFVPQNAVKDIGIVIYPSEKVKPVSYANMARLLAQKGYKVSILKLRLNQPDLSFGKGKDLMESKPDIKKWFILAHASGASIAYKDALKNKNIKGFVFMGAVPEGDDLNLVNMPVLSIWGTNDGLLDFTRIKEAKKNLPSKSKYYAIEGGNSTNFADIELVSGDEEAIISPEKQQARSVNKIAEFIDLNKN